MSAPRYRDVMEAADSLHAAADLIRAASDMLDRVPGRFLPRLEDIKGAYEIDTLLGDALDKLADRISLDADAYVEMRV